MVKRVELRRCDCYGCKARLEAQKTGDWSGALAALAAAPSYRKARLTAGRKRAKLTGRRKALADSSNSVKERVLAAMAGLRCVRAC